MTSQLTMAFCLFSAFSCAFAAERKETIDQFNSTPPIQSLTPLEQVSAKELLEKWHQGNQAKKTFVDKFYKGFITEESLETINLSSFFDLPTIEKTSNLEIYVYLRAIIAFSNINPYQSHKNHLARIRPILKEHAEEGDAFSQLNFAFFYIIKIMQINSQHTTTTSIQKKIEKNARSYKTWLTKSANQGNAVAQFFLGQFYEFNMEYCDDIEKSNMKSAEKWYLKSADQGHSTAQAALGVMYFRGDIDNVDKGEGQKMAIELLTIPAKKGNALAQYNLGQAYLKSSSHTENGRHLAKPWLIKAAEQNHKLAKSTLEWLETSDRILKTCDEYEKRKETRI